jgi:hypothetical protein
MPYLPPPHHETSKRDSPNETKIKVKQTNHPRFKFKHRQVNDSSQSNQGTDTWFLTYHSAKLYKERTKRWHDKCIKTKQFKPGDKVLLFNSHVHLFGHGKLRSKWKGPYLVPDVADHGTVTLQCDDGDTFKANDQHLKLFLEPNPQDFEKVDVLDFLEL